MRGLDPRIHDEQQQQVALHRMIAMKVIMDCRVKPGNDQREAAALNPELAAAFAAGIDAQEQIVRRRAFLDQALLV